MRIFAVTGPFVPTNEPMTLLPYKQLRLLDAHIDVCALSHDIDYTLENKIKMDMHYDKFNVIEVGAYNDVLFSIKNVNLFKALYSMKKYVERCQIEFKKNSYDIVYTSSFPAYTHKIGYEIKKKKGVKWVANFTDPINHSPYKFDQETYKNYMFLEKMAFHTYNFFYVNDNYEKMAFENADLLIFICEEQRNFMIEQYCKYDTKISKEKLMSKSVLVPLNYIEEWNEIDHRVLVEKKSNYITLAHFGRIYGLRKIEKFIVAVSQLLEENPDLEGTFKIKQFGEFRKSDMNLVKNLKLQSYFQIHDKIPYEYCINEMANSDVLLIFDTILEESQWQPYLPSKIIEYSKIGKNVLAITTKKSPTYRIMKESNANCCSYDVNEIKKGILKALSGESSVINYCMENEKAVESFIEEINKLVLNKSKYNNHNDKYKNI